MTSTRFRATPTRSLPAPRPCDAPPMGPEAVQKCPRSRIFHRRARVPSSSSPLGCGAVARRWGACFPVRPLSAAPIAPPFHALTCLLGITREAESS